MTCFFGHSNAEINLLAVLSLSLSLNPFDCVYTQRTLKKSIGRVTCDDSA